MIKANIFGAESAIEFLNTNDLKEAIRQFVENDQITLPSAFTKLKLDTDKDLSSLPKEVKPEADEMKAYMAAYTMEEYRADVFKMLAINIWRLYMQYSENGSTAGECFLMMLKGNGRIPFLGKLLKENMVLKIRNGLYTCLSGENGGPVANRFQIGSPIEGETGLNINENA